MGCKKQYAENRVLLFKKRSGQATSSPFDPVFCILLFVPHIFDLFDPKTISGRPDKVE